MDVSTILLNIYYFCVAAAFLVKDIFWLRSIMILAWACLITYGIVNRNNIILGWNSIFIAINIFHVVKLIIERRHIEIEDDIIDIYNEIFNEMTRHEFKYFWKHGVIRKIKDTFLCKAGEENMGLFLILNGTVQVIKKNKDEINLTRGFFVAEMGLLTSKPVSADVKAEGKVKYIYWTRDSLNHILKVHSILDKKLRLILEKDLISKLKIQ